MARSLSSECIIRKIVDAIIPWNHYNSRSMLKKNKVSQSDPLKTQYREQQKKHFKGRTRLFIVIATGIYFVVSFFYFVRFIMGNPEAFLWIEFYCWAGMIAGSFWLYYLNETSNNPDLSKRCSYGFDILLLAMLSFLGLFYPASVLVFPFYFALSLIIIGFTMPWNVSEMLAISVAHLAGYSVFYFILTQILDIHPKTLPRFHPYFDGMLFIMVCGGICTLLCKKKNDLDFKNFTLLKEVEEKNSQIQADLEFANLVHRTLVPKSVETDQASITVSYLPKSYVGGDYARFYFADKKRLTVFIGDVTGHGVASALLVNRLHAELESLAKEGIGPGELLKRLNRFICDDFQETGLFLSAFCGVLDFDLNQFSFSNYGHPPQYLHYEKLGQIKLLPSQTLFLGVKPDDIVYEEKVPFNKGDRIVLFTDGILEAKNQSGEPYGNERFENFLKNYRDASPANFNDAMLRDLRKHHGASPHDDVFLLSILIR